MEKIIGLFEKATGLQLAGAVIALFLATSPVIAQTARDRETKNILAENYRIGVGDVIDIAVSKNLELSRSGVRVNNQGAIQLPMIEEDFPAACLTERELADRIRDKYKKYLLQPYVNVTVREYNASPVAFIGAVNSPGRFQMQRPMRILDLVTYVNGPAANAGERVEIIRNRAVPYCDGSTLIIPEEGGDEVISLSLDEALKGNTEQNMLVRAGDIIRIDQADIHEAYIIGNVRKGTTIQLKEPVTLTQAIAMAGGLAPDADASKVKIQRRVTGSLATEDMIVNLKEINQRKREDVVLAANDIVEVPGPTGFKKTLKGIREAILPSITRFPVRMIGGF